MTSTSTQASLWRGAWRWGLYLVAAHLAIVLSSLALDYAGFWHLGKIWGAILSPTDGYAYALFPYLEAPLKWALENTKVELGTLGEAVGVGTRVLVSALVCFLGGALLGSSLTWSRRWWRPREGSSSPPVPDLPK